MKLITCNIWGGRIYEPFIEFLKGYSKEVDIFCFQEIFHTDTDIKFSNEARVNIFNEIKNVLVDFEGFYAPQQDKVDYKGLVDIEVSFGIAMFVKKTIKVESHGDVFVFRERNARKDDHTSIGRNLEFLTFNKDNNKFAIFNLHGLWNGKGKTDTEERLEQSKRVKDFIEKFNDSKIILCGDFNLLPDTQSMYILEEGMVNLIKEYRVTNTRSSFYEKPIRYADYILVSPNVEIKYFKVLQHEISDHLPLLVEFE